MQVKLMKPQNDLVQINLYVVNWSYNYIYVHFSQRKLVKVSECKFGIN